MKTTKYNSKKNKSPRNSGKTHHTQHNKPVNFRSKLSQDGQSFWDQIESTNNVLKLNSLRSEIENYFLDFRDKQILIKQINNKITRQPPLLR